MSSASALIVAWIKDKPVTHDVITPRMLVDKDLREHPENLVGATVEVRLRGQPHDAKVIMFGNYADLNVEVDRLNSVVDEDDTAAEPKDNVNAKRAVKAKKKSDPNFVTPSSLKAIRNGRGTLRHAARPGQHPPLKKKKVSKMHSVASAKLQKMNAILPPTTL